MPRRLKVRMKALIDLLRSRKRKRNLLINPLPNSSRKKDRKREKKQRSRSRRRKQSLSCNHKGQTSHRAKRWAKVDLKQIPGKFSKWLVESFNPYSTSFVLSDGQRFTVTAFDVYMTLGVLIGGREIIEITKSSMDKEYDEVHAVWVKEWKIKHNAPELTHMPEFILAKKDGSESFKRNFIIYLVNGFFSGPKNHYCSKVILKYIKDDLNIDAMKEVVRDLQSAHVEFRKLQPKHNTNNDNVAPSLSLTLPLHKLDSEAQIPRTTLVADASVIVEKEDHHEDVPNNIVKKDDSIPLYSLGLGLSQPNIQSLTTSVPNPNTVGEKNNGNEDDDDNAPLRFPLRNTSQVNRELNIKKSTEYKSKVGDKPSSKKGEQATDSSKPKSTKEMFPKKDDEKLVGSARTPERLEEVSLSDTLRKQQPKNIPLAYCSPYVIRLTKLDNELSQDELAISEYVFGKVKDVDDSEPLFDEYGDKEATGISMATLKPGEEVEMNVINI
ncbi:LOW QUALITY PROTEIN: hypothetical protein Cgig2_032216 [Carnegiea gigantea]|uniref:Uncharacterized protein n=1 Tax=Carnegiea gigantea TaxID=171969 RepID=A0A9Q1JME0_9CARY|nr:LOW QUALITY PROTEIN: hypothetical protein Cgig2_032216 [Carnegiea gigantea]